ncbi:MAG TPA: hypothetical protein ENO00_14815 [Deltaproteobacteria bacterium]|nr:hypothetical protein [Deltaproteobacteria bacterium]
MKILKKKMGVVVLSLAITLFLTGCVEIFTVLSVPLTALQLGATAYQSIEKADIDSAVVSNIDTKDLKKIKRVVVVMGGESTEPPVGRIGDLGAVVGDNLCVQLSKLGFTVRDGNRLESSIKIKLAGSGHNARQMAAVGKALGVQAVVTGNITAGQNRSYGMLGVGRMNTVVQSATLKIIDVKKADTLILVTINYKNGQNPHIAAEGIAMVLKAKMEDPTLDIKKVIKKEHNHVG